MLMQLVDNRFNVTEGLQGIPISTKGTRKRFGFDDSLKEEKTESAGKSNL